MKKLTIAVGLLTIFNSCTTGSSGTSVTPLNSTEIQLVGTWYLTKETGPYPSSSGGGLVYVDTTFTGYNHSYFLTFKSDKYAAAGTPGVSANYKQAVSSCNMPALMPVSTTIPVDNNMYWYYDSGISYLNVVSRQYTIVSVSGSALVLKIASTTGTGDNTYYYSK